MSITEQPATIQESKSLLDDPRRFRTDPATMAIDRFMNRFIKIGGVSLIAAVFGIFIFIFVQILPLFQRAQVKKIQSVDLASGKDYRFIGVDEWAELPFVVDSKGQLTFIPVNQPHAARIEKIPFSSTKEISVFRYKPAKKGLVYGSADGYFSWVSLNYDAEFMSGKRQIKHALAATPWFSFGADGWSVSRLDYGGAGQDMMAAAILRKNSSTKILVSRLEQEQTLFGAGEIRLAQTYDLSGLVPDEPDEILVNSAADGVIVSAGNGTVYYFARVGNQMELRQSFKPFADQAESRLSSMAFLFGDMSLVFVNTSGENRIYSLFIPENEHTRLFGLTKKLKNLNGPAVFYAPSSRNKAFLLASERQASLRFATTGQVRWDSKLPFTPQDAVISGKFEKILFLGKDSKIHLYSLKDPHPEAGFQAFFGKIWYEGSPEPKFEWQSTGGSDEFEPKLSLIPLVVGTLKGTFYAMMFALPIALLAAIYTSQFLNPRVRALVKPTIEIMASLPSVVLGFLAALWLAPLIEDKVPSILLMLILVPVAAMGMGLLFQLLPISARQWVRGGYEFIVMLPVFLLVASLSWHLGPFFEKFFFAFTDPATGQKIADFRQWWPHVTSAPFDQRNSLVVGFMMGFAVIPIIYTITEDSLSNVPEYLRSGSLALGASRWQTAIHVILPTAFPGIFSALMVGLGRAIGETMIVVMATGNTPVMDLNIFSGMRTLSANIAVELPEAPHHSTLYRTLFLGALVLFLATFVVNAVAEILRQKIREKYKTV